MADFAKAHTKTGAHEQGWVNHRHDKGGETWAGITRKHHPLWAGWVIVDQAKEGLHVGPSAVKSAALDRALATNPALSKLTADFFKAQYWNPLNLDTEASQAIAEKAFDIAVNMGVGQAKKMLAEAMKWRAA